MQSDRPDTSPWRQLLGGGHVGRLLIICTGVWLHAADGLLVATMMPRIIADIGGASVVPWTIALYEVGSIAAGAASALLALRYGLRNAMVVAALTYMTGCIMSALAPEMGIMLAGRLAQGLGGGGLMALSFVAISSQFPRVLMPQVMAVVSMLWGVSAFLGPLVGGVFAAEGYWRGGFWFFALQAAGLAIWIWRGLRDAGDAAGARQAGRLPWRRLALLAAGVVLVAAAGIDVTPLRTTLLAAAGLVMLALFLRLDGRREQSRLLPPRALDPRDGVGAALLMVLSLSAATIAVGVYGPILMTRIHGVSELTAGYVLALSSIGWSVLAISVSGVPERLDGTMILGGVCLLTTSVVGFIFAVPEGPVWLIGLIAFIEGAGFGMAWTFILRRAQGLATDAEQERTASALPTMQRFGYALGAAYVGIVANAAGFADTPDIATAQSVGFWIFILSLPLAAVGIAATLCLVRRRPALQPNMQPAVEPVTGTTPARPG
jgi:predicted MFS family arabinose efflux permease